MSETHDHEQAIRDYYAHCDQVERAEAAELPPVPNIIAALDAGTATPELISEWANHPYVCTTDIIRRAVAALLAARAAEATQHREELIDARRAEHTVWKSRAEAAEARLAAEATQHQQEIAAKDAIIKRIQNAARVLVDGADRRGEAEVKRRVAAGLSTLDSEREMNAILTNENDALRASLATLRAERDLLKAALEAYMAQFGQALDAHYIPYDDFQRAADAQARAALSGEGTAKP